MYPASLSHGSVNVCKTKGETKRVFVIPGLVLQKGVVFDSLPGYVRTPSEEVGKYTTCENLDEPKSIAIFR